MPARPIVLVSASPRRADLLRGLGLELTVAPADVDESPLPGEPPGEMAERLARAKVGAARGLPSPVLAIAADTIVVLDKTVFGKPRNRSEARGMLERLAGRTHEVITAMALKALPEGSVICERAISKVTFADMTRADIDWYVDTGEGADKAGAYALQGIGALFVAAVEGSYTNVIGLPLDRLYAHLRRFDCLP